MGARVIAATMLTDIGAAATAIAAILGVIILLSRLAPVKWVWRQLVSDPLGGWTKKQIRDEVDDDFTKIKDELSYNHGSSVKDMVHKIAEALDLHPPDKP